MWLRHCLLLTPAFELNPHIRRRFEVPAVGGRQLTCLQAQAEAVNACISERLYSVQISQAPWLGRATGDLPFRRCSYLSIRGMSPSPV